MMPGGHLATSVALAAGVYALTGSMELTAGCVLGGFLIDVDHYVDYLFFEGQWRKPGPASFLRYYFTQKPNRLVLPLHSIELMTILAVTAAVKTIPVLTGYLLGAALHLVFDIIVNGDHILKRRIAFYSFAYRATQRFSAANLLDEVTIPPETGARPFREFFTWCPPEEKVKREPAGDGLNRGECCAAEDEL
jgi:hypothetical protein